MNGQETKLEDVALQIYGSTDSPEYQRWVKYWGDSRKRNRQILEDFERLILIEFEGKRVLDIGCGTGGLGELIGPRCKAYVGLDYHAHVLQFANPDLNRTYLQASGVQLPFQAASFDTIICFDVIEHLIGGERVQIRFLQELQRILSPLGLIFLTTPNFWYPYDAHTQLNFPQYLPPFIQDTYIAWRNPDFIKEHKSFENVPLIKPGFLKRALKKSRLEMLHDLPCATDRSDYLSLNPFRGLLAYAGLGWYLHAEFWMIVAHTRTRNRLRLKLRKHWYWESNQPSEKPITSFSSRIDFNADSFGHQIAGDWHWHERDAQGFRWMGRKASLYLESKNPVSFLRLSGFTPKENRFKIFVDGVWVGEHRSESSESFELEYLLPFKRSDHRLFEVQIEVSNVFQPDAEDKRELSLMVFKAELSA